MRTDYGVADPVHADAQALVHALPSSVVDAANRTLGPDLAPTANQLDRQLQLREEEYDASRQEAGQSGIDYWRRAGNIVGRTPASVFQAPRAMGVLREPVTGAVQEMLTEPVTDAGDFVDQKMMQGTEGAAKEASLTRFARSVGPAFELS